MTSESDLLMKRILIFLLLSSVFSCQEIQGVKTGNEFSNLFKITKTTDGVVGLTTVDEYSKVLSEVSFSNPYKRVVLLNTTYMSYVKFLGKENCVVGSVDLGRMQKFATKDVDANEIKSVGENGVLNVELIRSLRPDLIVCNSFQEGSVVSFGDIDVLVVNEFWEQHPLGRSEWVKVFGVLLGASQKAEAKFKEVKDRYETQNKAEQTNLPKVYNLSRFSSSYFLPGCESIVSKILMDAQCDVGCIAATSRSTEISEEQQLTMCVDKDYLLFFDWLPQKRRYAEVLEELGVQKCFKGDIVYCNTSSSGYFEKSIMEPDVLVNDLFQILHRNQKETKYFSLLKESE